MKILRPRRRNDHPAPLVPAGPSAQATVDNGHKALCPLSTCSLSLCFSGSLFLSGHFQDCKYCIPIAVRTTFVRITHDRDVYAAVIDEYYAACQDAIDTNGNGEVEEWNVVSAPQVKMLAEQCGCAAAGRAQAAVLWLATAAVVQHAVLH
eukprot:COSAG03_NODE_1024_length_5000_cov_3.947562_3_plen_150_part_00